MRTCSREGIPAEGFFAGGSCHPHSHTVARRSQLIRTWIEPCRPQVVLDIGCGHGTYTELLQQLSGSVLAVDQDLPALRQIRSAGRTCDLAAMDARRLAIRGESLDPAIAVEVLEHVPQDQSLIREAYRCLKPGGVLLVTGPSRWFLFETHPIRVGSELAGSRWGTGFPLLPLLPMALRRRFATVHLYTPGQLAGLLRREGFVIRRLSWLMPNLDSLQGKLPPFRGRERIFGWLRRVLEALESSPARVFGSTIVVLAAKVGS